MTTFKELGLSAPIQQAIDEAIRSGAAQPAS